VHGASAPPLRPTARVGSAMSSSNEISRRKKA
jgi:hypothetical protein